MRSLGSGPMYDRLLHYRYYCLRDLNQGVNATRMVKLRLFIKSRDITMKEHLFDGTDPILGFQLLIHLATEAYKLNMSEGKAYLALPTYLIGTAKTKVMSMQNGIRAGGITCWREAIQLFLPSFPTPNAIRDAVTALENIRQQSAEDETEYAGRFSTAFSRCGNVHDEAKTIVMFVNGL